MEAALDPRIPGSKARIGKDRVLRPEFFPPHSAASTEWGI